MNFVVVLLIVFSVVLLCLAGLGVKVLVRKKGEFKRHCAGTDPYTGKNNSCVCAAHDLGKCDERQTHPYQPLDVTPELMEEINGTQANC